MVIGNEKIIMLIIILNILFSNKSNSGMYTNTGKYLKVMAIPKMVLAKNILSFKNIKNPAIVKAT